MSPTTASTPGDQITLRSSINLSAAHSNVIAEMVGILKADDCLSNHARLLLTQTPFILIVDSSSSRV
jgi:hypothetical protein